VLKSSVSDLLRYFALIQRENGDQQQPVSSRLVATTGDNYRFADQTLRHLREVFMRTPGIAFELGEFLTCHKPAFLKGNESLQRVIIEITRDHLNAMRYDEALQYLRLLSVTPDMTEIPLKELFFALLSLSGTGSFRKLSLNRFLPGDPGATIEAGLRRAQVYEALFRTNRPFMLKLFASLESELDSKADAALPQLFQLYKFFLDLSPFSYIFSLTPYFPSY